MALKTMIENLNKAREAYESQLKSLGKDAQKAVAGFLCPLVPPGCVLRWTQYTPYFNDGDACTFSVHDPYLLPPGAKEDDDDFSLGSAEERYGAPDEQRSHEQRDWGTNKTRTVTYTVKGFPAIDGWDKQKIVALGEAWDELPHDLLEKAFGDHVEVVMRSDGSFEVSEYSHD